MKIAKSESFPVALPFKKPFTIALGTITYSPHVVVKMTTDDIITAAYVAEHGVVHLPQGPGLGVMVNEEKLEFYSRKKQ
jgi:L-alanine-DL-glutamate epimerase-like enolase superfamily enzyme